jgi:hypothetical protein
MQPTTLWIPSPKPFQQKPKRLSERKSMTIAAGLLCTDGLLICADTEMGGAAKFEQRKIRHGKDDSIGEYIIAGSGNTSYIGMFVDLVEEGVYTNRQGLASADDTQKIHLFREIVRQGVSASYKHIKDYPYETDKPTLELILGLHAKSNDEIVLLHIGVDGGLETIREGGVFIGHGAATALAFSRILWLDDFPLDMMRWIAMFVLYQAKMSALYCGGDTNLASLPRPAFQGWYSDQRIAEKVEEAMRLVLVHSRDLRLTPEEYEGRILKFADTLREIRRAMQSSKWSENFFIEELRKLEAPKPKP